MADTNIPAGFVLVDALAMHELRMELDKLGEQVIDVAAVLADPDGVDRAELETAASELVTVGKELRLKAGVCRNCGGDCKEIDGEGGTWTCGVCEGKGFTNRFPPPSSEEQDAEAAEYQAWLESPDGQAAVAAAMQPQETPHG